MHYRAVVQSIARDSGKTASEVDIILRTFCQTVVNGVASGRIINTPLGSFGGRINKRKRYIHPSGITVESGYESISLAFKQGTRSREGVDRMWNVLGRPPVASVAVGKFGKFCR